MKPEGQCWSTEWQEGHDNVKTMHGKWEHIWKENEDRERYNEQKNNGREEEEGSK